MYLRTSIEVHHLDRSAISMALELIIVLVVLYVFCVIMTATHMTQYGKYPEDPFVTEYLLEKLPSHFRQPVKIALIAISPASWIILFFTWGVFDIILMRKLKRELKEPKRLQ